MKEEYSEEVKQKESGKEKEMEMEVTQKARKAAQRAGQKAKGNQEHHRPPPGLPQAHRKAEKGEGQNIGMDQRFQTDQGVENHHQEEKAGQHATHG